MAHAARSMLRSVKDTFSANTTYRLIARNRIRWFGHADDCTVVDPQLASRLLP